MDIPNSYRIMKLTSGDNIICEIKNSSSTRYRVKRPMTIKTTVQFDARGNQRDYTILRNWMNHSNEIETNISTDYVITILKPNDDIVSLYENKKEVTMFHFQQTFLNCHRWKVIRLSSTA